MVGRVGEVVSILFSDRSQFANQGDWLLSSDASSYKRVKIMTCFWWIGLWALKPRHKVILSVPGACDWDSWAGFVWNRSLNLWKRPFCVYVQINRNLWAIWRYESCEQDFRSHLWWVYLMSQELGQYWSSQLVLSWFVAKLGTQSRNARSNFNLCFSLYVEIKRTDRLGTPVLKFSGIYSCRQVW